MDEHPRHIKFQNRQNPRANFDLINLEKLFQRKALDHDPQQLHIVEFYIIIFVTAGVGKHTIDFTDFQLEKGSILTIRKDQLHKFYKSGHLKGDMLLFTDDFLVSYLEKLEAIKAMQLFNEQLGVPKIQLSLADFETLAEIVERIKNEYFNVNDEYSQGIIRSELHILITKLFRIKSHGNQIITSKKYLEEFIEFQKLVETNWVSKKSVKEYAQMMAMSTKTLNNISQFIINKTAKDFIKEIGITQIKRLLINTDLSIKEVAYQSGFEETTNFFKFFKREMQMTPEQYRTSNKK